MMDGDRQHFDGRSDFSAEGIRSWLVSRLSGLLEIQEKEIDVGEPFASYGLGSTELVSLSGDLADWLGRQLPADLAYECPTIDTLARHLAEAPGPSSSAGEWKQSPLHADEAIAIIGIGCRFPGASNPQSFWDLLRNGTDAIREVPADRFSLPDFYDSDPAAPGKMITRWGGFIEQVDQFDAHFFGISPREAVRMDPQQRLLLEVAWEALEDAGQVRERLAGTPTGVFIGISNNDYGRSQFNDPDRIDAYAGTGNALSIAANRISYIFDFRGPSIAVDSACSSSLVAVHQACSSLRSGESTLALAGGVNLILSPAVTINFSKAGVMSPDGRCKPFDARANGYVRSEGAGIIVLKSMTDALADGDPIYAVIRGSAVNQDGRSNGLMAPNPLAQEAVLREAYRQAAVCPADVQYVEAHGTGTLLGDPIEAKALGAVLGLERPPDRPCVIGSVKSNLGHLEAAAGIAGLIKVALALQHREIPPSLHFEQPNPHIPFDRLPLRVQTKLDTWPTGPGPALAGVSSFGFGGTNSHIVLQEAPASHSTKESVGSGGEDSKADLGNAKSVFLLPLSARSPESLLSLVQVYQDFLTHPSSTASPQDICYSASVRRTHHQHRVTVTGDSNSELAAGLGSFINRHSRSGLSFGDKPSDRRHKLVFVFPGQGSQWFGMGRTLLKQESVFRDSIERCDREMRAYGDWSLLAELTTPDEAFCRLDEVDIQQPALFAIQLALTALWRSWAIEPSAIVGHSMGEVAAAHCAGALSLTDAVRVICSRSRLVKSTIGRGAMATVELSVADARRALVGYEDRVSIAVSNSYTSTVLSGDPAALETIVSRLQRRDIFCRMVNVDFAAHSPQMDPLCADLRLALRDLDPRAGSVPIYSSVTGQLQDGHLFDPSYWTRNLREPVLFSIALQHLIRDGYDSFLEIGPHPVLLSSIREELARCGIEGSALPSLRREEDEGRAISGSLGELYTLGFPIEWKRLYSESERFISLPSYPWHRERFWLDSPVCESGAKLPDRSLDVTDKSSILGRHFASAVGTHWWENTLQGSLLSYLNDHRVDGVALLPAAIFVELALLAAAEVFPSRPFTLKNIDFRRALYKIDGETRKLQTLVSPNSDQTATIQIYSCCESEEQLDKSWTLHATGAICLAQDKCASAMIAQDTPSEIRGRCPINISERDYNDMLGKLGIKYGPSLRSVGELWQGDNEILSLLSGTANPQQPSDLVQFHSRSLDGLFQTFGIGVAGQASAGDEQVAYMPTHIDEVRTYGRPGLNPSGHVRLLERTARTITGDARLIDEAGVVAVEILGLRFDDIGSSQKQSAEQNVNDWLYEFQWRLKERTEEGHARGTAGPQGEGQWLIFADSVGVGEELAALVNAQGNRGILVFRGDSFERSDDQHFRIRPEQRDDFRQLLSSVLASDQEAPLKVVHLWSLDVRFSEHSTPESVVTDQILGCGSTLHLVQELALLDLRNSPRLWLITQGAQPVGEEILPLNVAQTPLWGLGRVVAEEHPVLWGGLLDLDPEPSPVGRAANYLWEEISSSDGEDQIAIRKERPYVGRLVRADRTAKREDSVSWRADSSYLITGGLGDLGLAVARWMAERGARRLILLGRTKLPPRSQWHHAEAGTRLANQIAAIRELESFGVSVHLASVDVSSQEELTAFLNEFRAEGWPPIRGVLHAAGVLQDGLLVDLNTTGLNSVLRPKIMGSWLLHRLLNDEPLDFFVMFSSAGSILGQPGQGSYAAANAFMDALAHYRRAQGGAALSINWGAWDRLGFAATPGGQRLAARVALSGVYSIEPAQALEVLATLLRLGSTQIAAVRVDWKQYSQFRAARTNSRLLSELVRDEIGDSDCVNSSIERKSAVLAVPPAQRRELLQSYLTELVARVLGLSGHALDARQSLGDLGLDSLMAVELKNRIAIDFGVNLPIVTFLSGPSIERVAGLLLEQFVEALTSAPAIVPANTDRPNRGTEGALDSHPFEQFSDREVESLLLDLLAEEEAVE